MEKTDEVFLRKAIELALKGIQKNAGGPFGAVIVKEGKIVGQSWNNVFVKTDPTAHAEVEAIRDACKNLGTNNLNGCILYTSCEPCPMCVGAIFYADLDRVVFSAAHADADRIAGFGVDEIYEELEKEPTDRDLSTEQLLREEGLKPFYVWKERAE